MLAHLGLLFGLSDPIGRPGAAKTVESDTPLPHLAEAFPRQVADDCRAILWRKTGCDPDDPATWTQPVVRVGDCPEGPSAKVPPVLRSRR